MSATLGRLERADLIQIVADPADGRGKRVSITDAGRAMRERCIALLAKPMAEVEDQVPAALMRDLLPLLTELRQILDRMRD